MHNEAFDKSTYVLWAGILFFIKYVRNVKATSVSLHVKKKVSKTQTIHLELVSS